MKRFVLVILVTVVLLASLSLATPQGRSAGKTVGLVLHVLPGVPIKSLGWHSGDPTRMEIRYKRSDGYGSADIYMPHGDGVHAAVLLSLGVNPAGRDDPRLINLSEGLARTGMVVMIPWSEDLAEYRISPDEIDDIVHAYKYLLNLKRVDVDRSGMAGFCVGASLATVAAQDDRIAEQVKFINFFGGYFDARNLLKAVLSQTRFGNNGKEMWIPSDQAKEVVARHLIRLVPLEEERQFLNERFLSVGGIERIDTTALSQTASIVHQLLSGVSYEVADDLINDLPKTVHEDLLAISPTQNLDSLRAKMMIMHDMNDANVPSEESRLLAQAIKSNNDVAHTEFRFFRHMDPEEPVGVITKSVDAFKLFMHLYQVVRYAS